MFSSISIHDIVYNTMNHYGIPDDIKKLINDYSPILDETKLMNVLRCAGADASRNIATKEWSVKKGLKIVLNREPTTAQIKAGFNAMPNDWNRMVHVGWYMNASDTLKNKLLAMESLKVAIIVGIYAKN